MSGEIAQESDIQNDQTILWLSLVSSYKSSGTYNFPRNLIVNLTNILRGGRLSELSKKMFDTP